MLKLSFFSIKPLHSWSVIIWPYMFKSSGVLASLLTRDLVHLVQIEKLEGREG